MSVNTYKLNSEKTEILLLASKHCLKPLDMPAIPLDGNQIAPTHMQSLKVIHHPWKSMQSVFKKFHSVSYGR